MPFVENWIPNAKHKPEFTIGGRSEAEIAVPTIALKPPFDTARITATPEGAATMNPMMRLITEGRVRKREERSERSVEKLTFPSRLHLIALEIGGDERTGAESHDQASQQRHYHTSSFISQSSLDHFTICDGNTESH
jgi:hypothetical protein